PHACARATGVGLGAEVVIVAGRFLGRVGVAAGAGHRVAGARDVALVAGVADDRVGAGAHARAAAVGLGAGVAVVAAGSVGRRRVAAGAGHRIARAGDVTLILGGADHRVHPDAQAGHADVGLRAGAAVVAR